MVESPETYIIESSPVDLKGVNMSKPLYNNPHANADIEIVTNREWLATLSDEDFARQVLDVARTCQIDFTKKKCARIQEQERMFINWLKSQTFYTKM